MVPAAVLICVCLWLWAWHFGRQLKVFSTFDDKWPPIDDDEFLRRCPPGTRRETALKVRRIISEQLGVPYAQIYPEQSFVDDLDCD